MNHLRLATIAALMTLLWLAPGPAAAAEPIDGLYFPPDVVDQFNSLARRGDGLAFGVGTLPAELDMSTCKHFQGMARWQAPDGTPYMFLTRSGNDPGAFCVTGDDPGNLFIVRMGSRDTNGERLRTNRLWRDWDPYLRDEDGDVIIGPGGAPIAWTKPPDPRDATVGLISYEGDFPYYGHPGGLQMVGTVLAHGLENPYGDGPDAAVQFLDMANPESPQLLSQFPPGGKAGVVALTPVQNPDGPGLRYLMMTTGGDNDVLKFFRSQSTETGNPLGATDLKSGDLAWEPLITVTESDLEGNPLLDDTCFGFTAWPTGGPIRSAFGHQFMNFIHEGTIDGPLYAIGGRNDGIGGEGSDYLDLYRVNVDAFGNPLSRCIFTPVSSRHMSSFPFGGHGDSAALSAAGGVYISPSGELIVYGSEYDNKGPFEYLAGGQAGYRTVRFVEWRHINVVRPGSPTLHPTAAIDGPISVDEGGTVQVTGTGAPPITKAWLQLFEDDGAGSSLPGFLDDDDWLQIDFDDRLADHFEDLERFDETTGTEYWENAGSWRWFAPQGCTISANDYPRRSDEFPGPSTVQLVGDGSVYRENDLDDFDVFVPPGTSLKMSPVPAGETPSGTGFDDDIEGVTFYHVDKDGNRVHACEGYYNGPFDLSWDLDNDGSYEVGGASVTFSAAALDGPSTAPIGARVQSADDPTPLGTGFATGTVQVLNVAPAITQFGLFDSLGHEIGIEVPFAIHGTPLTARGAFTDPGRPDHQTGSLAWGDGVVEPSAAFDLFSDAFGGVVGQLSRRHTHAQPGDYTVALEVTDDDGGAAGAQVAVSVLTPLQAVGAAIDLLDEAIADATSDAERNALLNARKALAGSVEGLGSNGALDKLESDLIQAALVKLGMAIESLQAAQALGADVGPLIALLQQIAAALEAA